MAFDLKEFSEEITAQIDKMRERGEKLMAQRDDRIVALEKHVHDLAIGGRSKMGALPFREMLAGQKALIDRPTISGSGTHVNFELDRKTITGISVQVPQWTDTVVPQPMPPLGLRSLIPVVPVAKGAVGVTRKTNYTYTAAPVAEGTAKPLVTPTYTPAIVPIEKIAVACTLSKETYEDLPALVAELESELIYDVLREEEEQILKGTGTRPQLTGIYPLATPIASMPASSTLIDRLGTAIGELAATGYAATGAVVNGADWNAALLTKNTQGEYILGSPVTMPANRIWSIPVVTSQALIAGEFLVGAWPRGARIYERESVNIVIATQHQDDFIKNLVTALCEMREALVILAIGAFRKNGTIAL